MEFNKEWAVGWGTLALINAGLAQSKHRSGLAWFLATVGIHSGYTVTVHRLGRDSGPLRAAVGRNRRDGHVKRKPPSVRFAPGRTSVT